MRARTTLAAAAMVAGLAIAGCSRSDSGSNGTDISNFSTGDANATGDAYGSTGAPGADLTDNGSGDASNGYTSDITGNNYGANTTMSNGTSQP